MCGILYSQDSTGFSDLEMLKRRGPEGFTELENDLGYFAHSMLNTIGESTPQPYHTKSGILLYNGSTYNSGKDNDTTWIGDHLDDNLQNTLEVVRQLNGEFAFVYVTEKNIVFCVDHFDSRNLWFYHDTETKKITVASLPNIVQQKHNNSWRASGNKIYIFNRQNYTIQTEVNKVWNLEQKVPHLDFVFESFERAISRRYNPKTSTNLLSSGFDSGVINCATHKLFKTVDCVCDPDKEVVETIKERMSVHHVVILPNFGEHSKDKETMFHSLFANSNIWDDCSVEGLINLMKKYVRKRNKKIVITGNGGDEIYNNWQSQRGGHMWTKTNGSFPSSLELIWPWHNDHERMQLTNTRTDMITGFNGLEARNPLLDTELVQAWINTKSNLKNSYKYWMKKYMDDHQYPYTMKKVHSWSDPYQPADWMLTNNDKNLTS
jgi:asparagine synthetase B (glutamine-hydrolysing)